MRFTADDRKGDFDITLDLSKTEKDSLEESITNLSVGLAGVVAELLHRYCRVCMTIFRKLHMCSARA